MTTSLKDPISSILKEFKSEAKNLQKISSKSHTKSVERINKAMLDFKRKKIKQEEKIIEEMSKTILF